MTHFFCNDHVALLLHAERAARFELRAEADRLARSASRSPTRRRWGSVLAGAAEYARRMATRASR